MGIRAFGAFLFQRRRELGLTQGEVVASARIDQSYLSRLERGDESYKSVDAIRKRAAGGSIRARKAGSRWEVWASAPERPPDVPPGVPPDAPEMPPGATIGAPDDAPHAPDVPVAVAGLVQAHMETLRQLEELRRENRTLAGQLGFREAQLQQANEQIRLLQAPPPEPPPDAPEGDAPAPDVPPEPRRWWQRLLGGL